MIDLNENLSTKWFDTLTVIPDDGDKVWFIVGDKIYVGVFIAEANRFYKADRSYVDLSEVRQWTPLTGDKQLGNYPEEGQVIAAYIPDLHCFVTGAFSANLGQDNLGQYGPGILLDQEYNLFELGVNNPLPWQSVFEWYKLPLEPLLLLPATDSDSTPVSIGELSGSCSSCCSEDKTEKEEEEKKPEPQTDVKEGSSQIKSAIVAERNSMNENISEDRPMNNKLTETRVSYELTKYNYQPWGQAKEAWNYIIDNDKFDEFDSYLEEMYPEGIGETELNDILAYEPETVYPYIGLRDPYNNEVTEDDFDGYTELETVNDIYICDVDEDGEFADILEFFAKDMGMSEEDARKVLTDKGYIKDDQLVIPAGKVCTVKDSHYAYEIETEDFPVSFDAYQPDTSDFKLNESIKTLDLDNLKESVKKFEYSQNIIGYAEPGDDIQLFYKNKPIGFIDFESKKVFLKKNCPSEACDLFSDYRELNNSFEESKMKESGKRLKEDYGWEVKQDEAWDLLDEMVEVLGPEEMLMALAKAMGTYELEQNLAFICRQYDFRSQHLTNFEDEEDEEEIEESIKSGKKKLLETGSRDAKIKNWYVKTYPDDEMGQDMDDTSTFNDLLTYIQIGRDVYECLGVGDSLVRERVFGELAKRMHVTSDAVYRLWLSESKKTTKDNKLTERKVGNLDENVKEWYLKAHKNYDLGSKLKDNFTFKDVYTGLGEGKNIYDMFGVNDTLVRQHIFYELSKRLRVDNNVILSLWLGDWGNPYGESKKVKDAKLKEAKSDGWPEGVLEAFENVFDDIDRFQYEVRNCVRGCYTGVDDMEGLTDAARKIGEEWMDVVDNDLQYVDDPDDEE